MQDKTGQTNNNTKTNRKRQKEERRGITNKQARENTKQKITTITKARNKRERAHINKIVKTTRDKWAQMNKTKDN